VLKSEQVLRVSLTSSCEVFPFEGVAVLHWKPAVGKRYVGSAHN